MNSRNLNKKIISLYFATMFSFMHAEQSLIVTISGNEVMTKSETGKNIQNKLQSKQQELATPLQADEKKIQDLEKKLLADKDSLEKDFADLDKARKTMSPEAAEQKSEALRDRALKFEDTKREMDRLVQKFQTEARKLETKMSEMYQKEMNRLDAMVKETVKELALKNNWELVLMEETVMYSSPKVSKTALVIEALDKKAKEANQAKKAALEKDAKSTVKPASRS